jgi:hypothetical protein
VLQNYIHAVEDAEARRDRLTRQIEEVLPSWSMAPVVIALQAMRGVALVVAVTVVAEVGDFRRFANARQLMAYLGLVPSEHSSGSTIRRGGITQGRQHAGAAGADRRSLDIPYDGAGQPQASRPSRELCVRDSPRASDGPRGAAVALLSAGMCG